MSPALFPALIALGTTVLALVLCVALLPAPMAAFWGIPAAALSGVWIWAGLASAKASARHASSASAVISGVGAWQIIMLVIVTSLLCGAAGFALPGGNRAPDIIGAAIIVAGCVYWGLGSAAVSLNEQRIAEAERPAMAVRTEHRQQSSIAFSCLGRVNALRPNEAECKLAIDRLARKIRTIELALAHSHGGGVGSLDRGPEHSFTDTERMVIMQAVAALEDSIRSLEAVVDSPDEIARAMGHALSIERLLTMKGML